ncbi:MAG: 4-hydroxy-tetrahydrodipicolinate synthase, partial [Verrucomicrobiota bacterium]
MFRGTFTAIVTPFRDGEIDVPALEALVDGQIRDGVSGVVAVGTTGESPTLSAAEREQVIRVAVEVGKGRCQVLAGTGS